MTPVAALDHGAGRSAALWLPRRLSAWFLLLGLTFAGIFALTMPPYQNADEHAHILRADQVSRGQWVAVRLPNGQSGGPVDPSLTTAFWPFHPILFHPEIKATRPMFAEGGAVHWSGTAVAQSFTNTAVYFPAFYTPVAFGLWLGRFADWTILHSLTAARLANAGASVALASFGLLLGGAASPVMFALLCLPMTLALMSSGSQDGMLLATAAFVAGAIHTIRQRAAPSGVLLAATTVALAMLCMTRPPYVPLAVVPLLLAHVPWRWRLCSAVSIGAACVGWSLAMAIRVAGVLRPDDPDIDMGRQLHWIVLHPAAATQTILESMVHQAGTLSEQFVGVLGWLDTPLPSTYVAMAWGCLGVAAVLSLSLSVAGLPRAASACHATVLALALTGSAVLVFLIQYLTWTKVGNAMVDGVQGRYFLPLALVAAGHLPSPSMPRAFMAWQVALLAPTALFPLVSMIVVVRALVLRYYL